MIKNTVEQIKQAIHEGNVEDEGYIAVHNTIAAALEKWEGKKLNKRAHDQVRAALEAKFSGFVSLCYCGNHYSIYGDNIPVCPEYTKRALFYIGHAVEYTKAEFERLDACHGSAASDRMTARIKLLLSPVALIDLTRKIEAYKKAAAELGAVFAFGSVFEVSRYDIERATGLRGGHRDEVLSYNDIKN